MIQRSYPSFSACSSASRSSPQVCLPAPPASFYSQRYPERLQVISSPSTDLIRSTIATYLSQDSPSNVPAYTHTVWDTSRANDFKYAAHALYAIARLPPASATSAAWAGVSLGGVAQLDKWLASTAPVPAATAAKYAAERDARPGGARRGRGRKARDGVERVRGVLEVVRAGRVPDRVCVCGDV
jgi:hypothetical protein